MRSEFTANVKAAAPQELWAAMVATKFGPLPLQSAKTGISHKARTSWHGMCIYIPCVYTWKERERERHCLPQQHPINNKESHIAFILFYFSFSCERRERTICESRSASILIHALAEVTQNGEVNSTEASLDKLYGSSVSMREVRSDVKMP